MAKQTFTTGQVLTAAQQNSLQANDFNQTVSVKTANYSLLAADKGTRIEFNTSGSVTCTVNSGQFDAGDTLIIQNRGAGTATITAGTATVNTSASLALSQYSAGTLYFVSDSAALFFGDAAGISASIVDAKGDLIVGTADNTVARLAVGTNGHTLVADSSVSPTGLKWAAAASSSWVKITSGTISASAATDIDSVFTSTYKHYVITLDNLSGSSATADLQIQFRTTVPGTYASNYYGGSLKLIYNSSTPVNINHNAEPYVLATQDIGGSGGSGILFITASNTSAFNPSVQGFLASHNSAINTMPNVTTDPINAGGIRISVNTGTFSTNYIIYGVTE